jgi:hypothetical protein
MFRTIVTTSVRASKFRVVMLAALALLVAAPVAGAAPGDGPALSPVGSGFPWAGLLVGLGLAGVACLLGLIMARGSFPRRLGR